MEYWFRCPKCCGLGAIDADQADGRVSIVCPTEGCGFHETGVIRPLIPTSTAIKPKDAPTLELI